MERDYSRAFNLQKHLNHYIEAMQIGTFPAGIKYVLNQQGLSGGYVRTPLQDLNEEQRLLVQDCLKAAKSESELHEKIAR